MPGREVLPSTLRRSPEKAQRDLGEDARLGGRDVRRGGAVAPHRLRRGQAPVREGRRPLGAEGAQGPERPAGRRRRPGPAGAHGRRGGRQRPKDHLMAVARKLDVPGRSRMTKPELVKAIQKANDRATRKARGDVTAVAATIGHLRGRRRASPGPVRVRSRLTSARRPGASMCTALVAVISSSSSGPYPKPWPLARRGCAAPPGAPPNTALTLTVPTGSSRQARCACAHRPGQHRGGQPVRGVGGAAQRLVERVDHHHRGDRPERLLPHHRHLVPAVGDHGGRVERARPVRHRAAGAQPARRPPPPRATCPCTWSRCRRSTSGPSSVPRVPTRARPAAPRPARTSAADEVLGHRPGARRSAPPPRRSGRRWRTRPARPARPPRPGRRRRRRSAGRCRRSPAAPSRRCRRAGGGDRPAGGGGTDVGHHVHLLRRPAPRPPPRRRSAATARRPAAPRPAAGPAASRSPGSVRWACRAPRCR